MFMKNAGRILVIAIATTVVCSLAPGQSTVYKWVDAEGVVHFSDAPPDAAKSGDVESVVIPPGPAAPPADVTAPVATTSAAPQRSAESKATSKEAAVRVGKADITTMSLADLDLRCDDAREREIAPLRTTAIDTCKQDKRNDPGWCERFNADFGDAGRTLNGTMRPRMFDHLPECVDALQERNRRGR